jgi:hypothetical protein
MAHTTLPDELLLELAPREDDDEITGGFLEGVREVVDDDADMPRPELDMRGLLDSTVAVG